MNSIFQINKVYSNAQQNAIFGDICTNKARFMTKLYQERPHTCPWPLAMDEAKKQLEAYKDAFTYFYPTKRTKCFIYMMEASIKLERRFKLRIDANGNEFVEIDKVPLYATDLLNMNVDEAYNKHENIRRASANHTLYIEKLSELEQYGYTYVANNHKLTTIDELRQFYLIDAA